MVSRSPLTLLVALLAGCSALGGPGAERGDPIASVPEAAPAGIGDGLAVYLEMLRDLIEGDTVVQADVFGNVAASGDVSPTTTNRLMLALALATPGHPGTDAAQAQTLLRDILAAGDALLPEERILALIHLRDVEQRLVLDAEAERLQRAATAAATQRNDRTAQQLQAALEENRQLKLALDDARAKLDAITNIERSIRERENGSNPP